jgi:hypothetical protein
VGAPADASPCKLSMVELPGSEFSERVVSVMGVVAPGTGRAY